jgi:hypothetical protein
MSKEVNRRLISAESWNTKFDGEIFAALGVEVSEVARRLYALLRLIKDKFDLR